jgi:hypothetical protein
MCVAYPPLFASHALGRISACVVLILSFVCMFVISLETVIILPRFIAPLPHDVLSKIDHQQNVWNGENVFL